MHIAALFALDVLEWMWIRWQLNVHAGMTEIVCELGHHHISISWSQISKHSLVFQLSSLLEKCIFFTRLAYSA